MLIGRVERRRVEIHDAPLRVTDTSVVFQPNSQIDREVVGRSVVFLNEQVDIVDPEIAVRDAVA